MREKGKRGRDGQPTSENSNIWENFTKVKRDILNESVKDENIKNNEKGEWEYLW